jgi:hypothetical protein
MFNEGYERRARSERFQTEHGYLGRLDTTTT